ncbi:MAG: DUF4249 family protein, partial [Bacteroidota bacterium]
MKTSFSLIPFFSRFFLGSLSCLLLLGGCSAELEIFEEPQDIFVVYAVLDPNLDRQVIRVSKVFQVKADAYEYAANLDPSVKNLQVTVEGDDKTWTARQVEKVEKDTTMGDFGPTTSYYEIETEGDKELQEGMTYRLTIRRADDPEFLLKAETTIPPKPKLLIPSSTFTRGERCLAVVPIEDDVLIRFDKNPNDLAARASGFQVQMEVQFFDGPQFKKAVYGPTPVFTQSENCSSFGNKVCRLLKNGIVLAALRPLFKGDGELFSFDAAPTCGPPSVDLVSSVHVQVNAHDIALTQYI